MSTGAVIRGLQVSPSVMTTARISVKADIVCLSVAYDLGVPNELQAIPTERGEQNCIVLVTKLNHKSAIITAIGLLLLLTLPLKLTRPIVLLNQAA